MARMEPTIDPSLNCSGRARANALSCLLLRLVCRDVLTTTYSPQY